MAAAECDNFDVWLRKKLKELDGDDDVMGPYITGILDTDDPLEEKEEALQEVLEGIIDTGIVELCDTILSKWKTYHLQVEEKQSQHDASVIDLNTKLSKLINDNAHTVTPVKVCASQDKAMKEAILAQYGQVSDEENSDAETTCAQSLGNAEAVAQAEKEKRDRDKEDSQKKKEKDKEDRAKQKSKDEDRKEKEKKRTQKGERRR